MPSSYEDLVRPGSIDQQIYTDPVIFNEEMNRIFKTCWIYVAHASEIAAPGDYRTSQIGNEPVIVSRGEDGGVQVLLNRCRHRGAAVCLMDRGNAQFFRCQYHGWTYRNNGELVGITHPRGYEGDLDLQEHSLLRVVNVDSYRDFIFARMSETGPTLREYLGRAADYLDRFTDISPTGTIYARSGVHKTRFRANWKFQLENSVDGYHPAVTHKSWFEVTGARVGLMNRGLYTSEKTSPTVTRDLGGGHSVLDKGDEKLDDLSDQYYNQAQMVLGGSELVERLHSEMGEQGARDFLNTVGGSPFNLAVFPNLVIVRSHIRVINPLSVDETAVHLYPVTLDGVDDEVNQVRLRMHELFFGPAGMGQPDDVEMFARAQRGLRAASGRFLNISRGMGRETSNDGEIVGHGFDETPFRGQYRRWLELMTGESPAPHLVPQPHHVTASVSDS